MFFSRVIAMLLGRTNVNKFLVEEQRRNPALAGDFSMLISDIVRSCKAIARGVSRGALAALPQYASFSGRHERMPLDVLSNQTILEHCAWGGHLAAMSSAMMDDIYRIPRERPRGRYLLVFDPLDGTSNIDINLMVGSIFSILRCPEECDEPTAADFLQPGTAQVAAGYALYDSSTVLVLTLGNGTHAFTLEREIGEFLLTHHNMQIPAETPNFSINTSNERFWEPPVRRYVEECLAGKTGVRGKDFNMRWAATLVADVHRVLLRGGMFLYPRDTRDPAKPDRFPLLHNANPLAMLVEQAGGMASTGYERILEIRPAALHQQSAVILGARDEVERIERYHSEFLKGEDKPFTSPLFNSRSLFRTEE